jgi:large subunit ribosomal protein L9
MEIILLQDVKGLGEQFETVTVKPGYGRNYLIPQKMAVIANRPNKAVVAERAKQIKAKEARLLQEIETVVDRIKLNPIKIGAKVGATDKIFGSVTNVQMSEAIKQQAGVEIDRRRIQLPDEIKTLGEYTATLNFGENLKYDIAFEVVAE